MLKFLEGIKEGFEANGEGDKFKNEGFEGKQTEIQKVKDSTDKSYAQIMRDFETVVNSTPDELPSSGISKLLKLIEEKKTTTTLESIVKCYEDLETKILLDDKEKDRLTKLREAITDPEKYKDKVPSDLTEQSLNESLGVSNISASDIKLATWQGLTKYNKKADIEALVAKVKADPTKFDKFQDHLANHTYGEAKI